MIDTYFDRCDGAMGFIPTRHLIDMCDPRYYAGQLYATVLARMVAEARDTVLYAAAWSALEHKEEMRYGIPLGSKRSVFTEQGRRK